MNLSARRREREARRRERRWANAVMILDDLVPLPEDIIGLVDAGVSPQTWLDYAAVHGVDLMPQGQDPTQPTREVIMLHQAGVSPALLGRWLTKCLRDDPVMLSRFGWTSFCDQLLNLIDLDIPPVMAGLYVLAGHDPTETAADFNAGVTTAETLRVEAELSLPASAAPSR